MVAMPENCWMNSVPLVASAERLRMAVEAGEGAMGAFPLVLALAFGAAGLEGFQAAEGFDQQGLALGAEAQALLHGVAQAHLNRQAK
jgi:hypothetical protein